MSSALVINLDGLPVEETATVPTECVLDISGLGDVIGVEIINLEHTTGQRAPGSRGMALLSSGERVRWSYDQASDAFYVSISDSRSLDQRSAHCTVTGTNAGYLASVTVEAAED